MFPVKFEVISYRVEGGGRRKEEGEGARVKGRSGETECGRKFLSLDGRG